MTRTFGLQGNALAFLALVLAGGCSSGADDGASGGGGGRGGAAAGSGASGMGGSVSTGGSGGSGAGGGAQGSGGGSGASGAGADSGSGGVAGALGAGGSNTGGSSGSSGATGDGGPGGTGGGAGGSAGIGGSAGSSGSSGSSGSAGTGGTGGGGDAYPCNGNTSGYDAVVRSSGTNWTAQRGTSTVYTGTDMRAAMQAGVDSLTSGRTSKQSVLVQGSGSIAANARVSLPSYVVLNVCGTIDVTGSGSGDMAPIYARGRTEIEIPHVNITGSPVYGMFFRDVDNLKLGAIDLRVSSGLGIRIDNHGRADRANKVRNIQIDSVYVSGTGTQGVETYGVDTIRIGSVVARNVTDSGLLLNDTTNAEIGVVDAADAGAGTGYAAFRMANRNGRINNAYPTNIHVGQVIARRGGRGIFCVSESGGAVIDRVDIADTGNNSILIENCYNVNIAAQSGTVTGGGEIRLAARTEFANSSDITLQNLTVTNGAITENPCATNSTFRNNTLVNSPSNVCP